MALLAFRVTDRRLVSPRTASQKTIRAMNTIGATGTGPMAKSLFEEFDPWAFVIDRRRRARYGKTHMLNG